MKLRKVDDYCIRSVNADGSDGPYTITRCLVFGGYRYEVWKNRQHVSTHYDSAAAKAAAASHERLEAAVTA